jgi:predicted Na+-dependent transporter
MTDVPLAVALIAATVLLYGASIFRYHGYVWADQVCLTAPVLCASPHWVAFAAAVAAVCYFYRQSLNS